MASVGFRTTLIFIAVWALCSGERPEYHEEDNTLEVQTERSEVAQLQPSESPEAPQQQQEQGRRPSVGQKIMATLPVYAPLTGSRCRCLYEDFTCAVDEHFWSKASDNAPMGFCDVQPRREAFDEALQGLPSGSVPWSPELKSRVATLEDSTNALEAFLMPLGLQNPSGVQEEPTKNIGQKNHVAHYSLVYFTHRIAVAKGILAAAMKVISDKHAADLQLLQGLQSELKAAIEEEVVSNLDNAIAKAEAAEEPARTACQDLVEKARLRKTQVLQQIGKLKVHFETAIHSDRIKDLDAAIAEAATASAAVQKACQDSADAALLRKTQLLQQVEDLRSLLQKAIDSERIKDMDAALAEAETANIAVQEACQDLVEAARLRKTQLQQQIEELQSRLDTAIKSDHIQDIDAALAEAGTAHIAVQEACQDLVKAAQFRKTRLRQLIEELQSRLDTATKSDHIQDMDAALAEAGTANIAVQEACQDLVEAARLRKTQLQQQIEELQSRLDTAIKSDHIQDLDGVLADAENADAAVRGPCQDSIEKVKLHRENLKKLLREQLGRAQQLAGEAEVDLKQAVQELNQAKTGLESVEPIESGFTKSAVEVQNNIDQLEGEAKQLMETAAA